MKKFFIRTAVIIALLLLFAYAFIEYRQYRSYGIPIHKDAAMIMKVNADAFVKTYISEYRFGKKEEQSRTKDTALKMGLRIPANIFVYTVKGRQNTTFFTALALSNRKNFEKYVSKKLNLQLARENNLVTGSSGNITVCANDEYAAIAWSAEKEDVKPVLLDLVMKQNLMPKNSRLIEKLKNSRKHITIATDSAATTFDLKNKAILINGFTPASGKWTIPDRCKKRVFSNEACASFFLNAIPASSELKKAYSIKQYSVETDSLLRYFNGYTDFELAQSTIQSDTVISYGYNDNFEMTEQKTIKENKIPAVNMQLSASAGALLHYLRQRKIVSPAGLFNREVFPLYTVMVNNDEDQVRFSTGKPSTTQTIFKPTASFFELVIDFEKIRKQHDFPYFQKYTAGISYMQINGTRQEQLLNIRGTIDFDGPVLKTLMQVFQF